MINSSTSHNHYVNPVRPVRPVKPIINVSPFFNIIIISKVNKKALSVFQKIADFFAKIFSKNYKKDLKNLKKYKTQLKNYKTQLKNYNTECKNNYTNNNDLTMVDNIFHNNILSNIALHLSPKEILSLCSSSKVITETLETERNLALWSKETGIAFEPSKPLEEIKTMYQEIGIKYPKLIEALGGLETVYNFPVLDIGKKNLNDITEKDLSAPIMRGKNYGKPFIVFFIFDDVNKAHIEVFCADQYGNSNWHCYSTAHRGESEICLGELNFGYTTSDINRDLFREKLCLERVNRLVRNLPIGHSAFFENPVINKLFTLPADDAYLPELRTSPEYNFTYRRTFKDRYEVKVKDDQIGLTLISPNMNDAETSSFLTETIKNRIL